MKLTHFLSIVGFGPRGLFALEQFYERAANEDYDILPKVLIFETNKTLGTGKAWSPTQSESNWINIADRALADFNGRASFIIKDVTFPAFPSYTEWLEDVMDHQLSDVKDTFHPRKVMGAYLAQRANSIVERLISLDLLTLIPERVKAINKNKQSFEITTEKENTYSSQTVVLALGHLRTEISDQNQAFQKHARKDEIYFSNDCYSKKASSIYKKCKSIAIKGLGLSMIDAVRLILANYDGIFTKIKGSIYLKYTITATDLQIVPYSLDGLPSVPKPLGKHIDDHFSIAPSRQEKLIQILNEQIESKQIKSVDEILAPIAAEIAVVYSSLDKKFSEVEISKDDLEKLIIKWLVDPTTKHDHILDTTIPIINYMKKTCEMAVGNSAFSLDYVVGQVWRQLQPKLYNVYSHRLQPEILSELIQVDEKTKRYSYGPPVESILQLIALEAAGVVNLDYVNDPEINSVEKGFELKQNDKAIILNAMIDAIIPAPNVEEISEPLIKQLIDNKLIDQVSDKLGIDVNSAATHLVNDREIDGLYSLGRIIKGNVYGVDAILECFNELKIAYWKNSICEKL